MKPINVVAHRGNASEFPENTISAFHSAIMLGATSIELDVQVSADLVPFVCHDSDPLMDGTVLSDTLSQQVVGVPSLAEVAEFFSHYPHIKVFVEIKDDAGLDAALIVPTIVNLTSIIRDCVYISFDHTYVEYARQYRPSGKVGLVLTQYDEDVKLHLCKKDGIFKPRYDFVFVNEEFVQNCLVDDNNLWSGCGNWVVYEVTSVPDAVYWINRGAWGIETMQVAHLLSPHVETNRHFVKPRLRD